MWCDTIFVVVCLIALKQSLLQIYIGPISSLFANAIFWLTDFSSDSFDFSSLKTGE